MLNETSVEISRLEEREHVPLSELAARIAELPLALASYGVFRAARAAATGLFHLRTRSVRAKAWQLISEDMIRSDFYLTLLVARAPRWNPHAIAGNAGPFPVRRSVEFDVATLVDSSELWTAILYRHPEFEPVAVFGTPDLKPGQRRQRFEVDSGQYTLNLRYQNWKPQVRFPRVLVDGTECIPARVASADNARFFALLRERANAIHAVMQFHSYSLLYFQRWLPSDWIDRLFLPVGNPQTTFRYGTLEQGQALRLRVPETTLESHAVYVTLYDRASFPTHWLTVEGSDVVTPAARTRGFYLVRVCRKRPDDGRGVHDVDDVSESSLPVKVQA
jgi:Family of unknown function (DUF6208)